MLSLWLGIYPSGSIDFLNNTANRDDIDFKENNVQMRGDNSEVILDDGSKTYIFRKKIVPTISRRSTVKRKSMLPDGYIPSHRDNIVTLQDKVRYCFSFYHYVSVQSIFLHLSSLQHKYLHGLVNSLPGSVQ
jgi:hypothetical protein